MCVITIQRWLARPGEVTGSILPLEDFIHSSHEREVREESKKINEQKEGTISCKACGGGTCFTLGSACRDNENVRHKSCGG